MGETLQPGDSAVFVLISANPEQAVKRFSGYGGKIIRTTLSNKQAAKIEKVLNQWRAYIPEAATP